MSIPDIDGQFYFIDPPDTEFPRSPFEEDPQRERSGGGQGREQPHEPRHYRLDPERPFLASEREHTTILFGGLTWKHERLLQAVMVGQGYRCEYLPTPDINALRRGREFCNNGQCNPTYFTVGNLIRYLQALEAQGLTRQEIIDRYVFFTAGACGPCRFGMYESEFRLALKNAGFAGFRILIIQQLEGLDQAVGDAGLVLNLPFTLGLLYTFLLADLVNDIAYQFRPYEIQQGSVDAALARGIEHLAEALNRLLVRTSRWNALYIEGRRLLGRARLFAAFLRAPELADAMRRCRAEFEHIALDRLRVRPIVKITGEFWAQTTEGDGNFRMFSFLEQEGAQVQVDSISGWILYMLHQSKLYHQDRKYLGLHAISRGLPRLRAALRMTGSHALSWLRLTAAECVFSMVYARFRHMLGSIPEPLPSQRSLRRLAHPYYHSRIEGGEGHLEVAKSLYYSRMGLCHMVLSLKPFGCMPSTQSDGVQSAVTAHHPELLFLPIETSGEGVINAYSRVQMALSEAKQKAHGEWDRLLEVRCIPDGDLRENRPFTRLTPRNGAVSIAARVLARMPKKPPRIPGRTS